MKKIIFMLLAAVILSSCTSLPVSVVESNKYLGYKPIDPVPVTTVNYYSGGTIEDVYWESIEEPKKDESFCHSNLRKFQCLNQIVLEK